MEAGEAEAVARRGVRGLFASKGEEEEWGELRRGMFVTRFSECLVIDCCLDRVLILCKFAVCECDCGVLSCR